MLSSRNTLVAIIAVVILALAGTAGYFYWQYRQSQEQLNNPDKVAKEETQALIDRMSKLISLPESNLEEGEPTLATVLDKEKLKDQEFFKNAENNDKLLIYTKAQKAFLFRPSTGVIINVAPVNLGNSSLPTTVIRNGTDTANLAGQVRQELNEVANVTTTENASRTNYTTTVVVDVNGNKAAEAKAIADKLGVTVTSLPSGESKPEADVLVIIGSDQE